MSSNNTSVVITDTSCLIVLDKISSLNILHQLFEDVVTAPEISLEYGETLPAWIKVVAVKDLRLQAELEDKVDKGEASAIALTYEIDFQFLIVDDNAARKTCEERGIPFIGTLGVLIRAKQKGYLSAVKPLLDKIMQTDFRMSHALYHAVLNKANEL